MSYKAVALLRPPGTGKTSLLVATICRYVSSCHSRERRRLVVCAPTNKAVSVLATRFLEASSDSHGCTVNMLLVGDDDKLLESKKNSPLRPYFVYSWHTKVVQELGAMKNFFASKKDTSRPKVPNREELSKKAVGLRRRILNSLPNLPYDVKR